MEILYQYGGLRISMSKKLHKKIESLIGEVLEEESALLACGLVLTEAFDQARKSGDIEKMIDISDRWMVLSKMLSGDIEDLEDALTFKAPIGFTPLEIESKEEFDEFSPDGPDESQSRLKVRKKSRKL